MDWMQIVSALALLMFIIVLFPTALNMMKNSPKATSSDWQSVIIPLLAVILFVILLIELV